MAELSFKQISDKLNNEFAGENRKLVFWYDDKAEFTQDLESLEIENAKILHLEKDNQFYIKHFLERVDTKNNYLIYAPFPRPNVRDNHLEDTLLYSKQFFADRASLIVLDLSLDQKFKPLIEKYIKFFNAKERTQRFYNLDLEIFSKNSFEVALMSVLCKTKTAFFDEVVRVVLTEDSPEENKFLEEFETYNLTPAFWRMCNDYYGYGDTKPSLLKLLMTMFVTYSQKFLNADLPKAWKSFISPKSGNIIAFLDNLMNNILYREKYDELSLIMAQELQLAKQLKAYEAEALLNLDSFAMVDRTIIAWLNDRLLAEDLGAKLSDLNIPQICSHRRKLHFADDFRSHYHLLESAFHLIGAVNYKAKSDFKDIFRQYVEEDFEIDRQYRKFYFNYDSLEDPSSFESLRDLIENIYSNNYLDKSILAWNEALQKTSYGQGLELQREFFKKRPARRTARTVVIISDAMRYEVAHSLFLKLEDDEKCSPKIEAVLGGLPSITKLGMGSLLPHERLEFGADTKVSLDGLPTDSLKQRETVLSNYVADSRCIQFDDVKHMKKAELREVFTGMDLVYVYHNQIDARGDKAVTENEVFTACYEAVDEIYAFIKRVSVNANTLHFIVTADHGFIYKRDKLQESDKITSLAGEGAKLNRRFALSDQAISGDGLASYPLGEILGNDDPGFVSFPLSSNVFKVAGGGQNYVHGGSSPQELVLPLLTVSVEKGFTQTKPAGLVLVSMVQKITNLITSLDFIQTEPVSDVVKETAYKIFFQTEEGEKISDEFSYIADKKDQEPGKRIFRLKFNFKNILYDRHKQYYLVAIDENTGYEALRHSVIIDLAFADDFGFEL